MRQRDGNMKFVMIKCPGCGANLELNEERTSAYCSYCGCKLYVDDANAQDAAYESRQRKKRQQVLEQLDAISSAVAKEAEIAGRLDSARAGLSDAKNDLAKLQTAGKRLPVMIIIAALFLLFSVIGSDSGAFVRILQMLLICAASVGIYRIGDRRNKAKVLSAQQCFVDRSDSIKSLEAELTAAQEKTASYPVPEQCRNADAIEYLRKVISAGRAQNIPDAVLLYEEYMQRRQLQQQLNLQSEQMADMQRSLSYTNDRIAGIQRESSNAGRGSKTSKGKGTRDKVSDSKASDSKDSTDKDSDALGTLVAAGTLLWTVSKIINKLDR